MYRTRIIELLDKVDNFLYHHKLEHCSISLKRNYAEDLAKLEKIKIDVKNLRKAVDERDMWDQKLINLEFPLNTWLKALNAAVGELTLLDACIEVPSSLKESFLWPKEEAKNGKFLKAEAQSIEIADSKSISAQISSIDPRFTNELCKRNEADKLNNGTSNSHHLTMKMGGKS